MRGDEQVLLRFYRSLDQTSQEALRGAVAAFKDFPALTARAVERQPPDTGRNAWTFGYRAVLDACVEQGGAR